MLEKSHLTPSAVGVASAQLAEVWERTREIYRSAPYPEGSPELAELAMLKARDVAITKTVPRKQRRGRLSRLTEDHIARMNRREEEGPSFELEQRFQKIQRIGTLVGARMEAYFEDDGWEEDFLGPGSAE